MLHEFSVNVLRWIEKNLWLSNSFQFDVYKHFIVTMETALPFTRATTNFQVYMTTVKIPKSSGMTTFLAKYVERFSHFPVSTLGTTLQRYFNDQEVIFSCNCAISTRACILLLIFRHYCARPSKFCCLCHTFINVHRILITTMIQAPIGK